MARTKRGDLNVARLKELIHYDPEAGVWRWIVGGGKRKAGGIAGSPTWKGHLQIGIDGHSYTAQALAVLYMTGSWPKYDVDHRNLDTRDNRWSNLREATRSQNQANTRAPITNTSGFKGVSWNKKDKCWRAQIVVNQRAIHLGSFGTDILAAKRAYDTAATRYFGEFARAA